MKRTVAATAFLLALASCGGDTGPVASDVIDRQTFVETYVDLRLAAVRAPDFRVPSSERDQILARHRVSAEDLLRFADAYGRDLELMNEVWSEIEAQVQERIGETPPAN
jgi:hypothetical protein